MRELVNHRVCSHREIFFYTFQRIFNYLVVIMIFAKVHDEYRVGEGTYHGRDCVEIYAISNNKSSSQA